MTWQEDERRGPGRAWDTTVHERPTAMMAQLARSDPRGAAIDPIVSAPPPRYEDTVGEFESVTKVESIVHVEGEVSLPVVLRQVRRLTEVIALAGLLHFLGMLAIVALLIYTVMRLP